MFLRHKYGLTTPTLNAHTDKICIPINNYEEVHNSSENFDNETHLQMKVFKGWHPELNDSSKGYHIIIKKNNQELITYYGAVALN